MSTLDIWSISAGLVDSSGNIQKLFLLSLTFSSSSTTSKVQLKVSLDIYCRPSFSAFFINWAEDLTETLSISQLNFATLVFQQRWSTVDLTDSWSRPPNGFAVFLTRLILVGWLIQHCTLLHNIVQHCTTLYNIVQCFLQGWSLIQHCTLLYNIVQH